VNRTLKPRHKQLNDALVEKKCGPHTPKHKPVIRTRREQQEFHKVCREYGLC
jgi:hypothetical protein